MSWTSLYYISGESELFYRPAVSDLKFPSLQIWNMLVRLPYPTNLEIEMVELDYYSVLEKLNFSILETLGR